jgi:hypothetical protein
MSGGESFNMAEEFADVDFNLFCKAITNGWLFLIRVIQNRLTAGNGKILDTIEKKAVQRRVTVHIPRDSRRNIKARDAALMVRFTLFEMSLRAASRAVS